MCGSATDAMDVSRTSMKVGNMTEAAIHQGLQSGHQSASGFALGSSGRVVSSDWMRKRRACFCRLAHAFSVLARPLGCALEADTKVPAGTLKRALHTPNRGELLLRLGQCLCVIRVQDAL